MKKKASILLTAIIASGLMTLAFVGPEDDKEKADIRHAIEDHFFAGKMKSDPEELKHVIHEDSRLHNVRNGKLVRYVRSDFFSWLKDEDNSKAKFEILYIDVTGNVAAAKTREDGGKFYWVDYFNLVKLNGKWWILDKVADQVRK